jgi:hypothetical protein
MTSRDIRRFIKLSIYWVLDHTLCTDIGEKIMNKLFPHDSRINKGDSDYD